MNKKASIQLAVYGVVAFLLIILVLAVFWFFFVAPYKLVNNPADQTILAKEKIDADLTLLNYLRTPVKINNEDYLMSDLIRFYYFNKNYENQLREETTKIFINTFDSYTISFNDIIFLEEVDNMNKIKKSGTILKANNNLLLNNKQILKINLEAGVISR